MKKIEHCSNSKIGYARVSTVEQNISLQVAALKAAGCDELFCDSGESGANFRRPGLESVLKRLAPGDTLIVWRLDRLGRSLFKLIDLINSLDKKNINFISVTEAINTSSASGLLTFHLMGAMAEFERTLISERTKAGILAARQRGARIGRKPALTPTQQLAALEMMATSPINEVAEKFSVHPRTLYRMKVVKKKSA